MFISEIRFKKKVPWDVLSQRTPPSAAPICPSGKMAQGQVHSACTPHPQPYSPQRLMCSLLSREMGSVNRKGVIAFPTLKEQFSVSVSTSQNIQLPRKSHSYTLGNLSFSETQRRRSCILRDGPARTCPRISSHRTKGTALGAQTGAVWALSAAICSSGLFPLSSVWHLPAGPHVGPATVSGCN